MRKYLGIDVGGTNIKCGIVSECGEILHHEKIHTPTLRKCPDFGEELVKIVRGLLKRFPSVKDVGIGLPGTLNKHKSHTIELPNIPELNDYPLLDKLQVNFPQHSFVLENDANAAALGELYFSKVSMPQDYIFVTLGTGVGGAIVANGQILKGGDGNSGEFGHMISRRGKRLEVLIGKKGFIRMAKRAIKKHGNDTLLAQASPVNTRALLEAAKAGDKATKKIFYKAGQLLGEALVSIIRVLDIKDIYVGGGISSSYEFLERGIRDALKKSLTPYYLKDLRLQRATLENQAGILGAASLCISKDKLKTAL